MKQNADFSIEIDQHEYVRGLQKVSVSKERRTQPQSTLTAEELHHYRSIVGQLAWPARESMPQLAYAVSDLQQRVAEAKIGDLVHANNVLHGAMRNVQMGQKLKFLPLGDDVRLELHHSDTTRKGQSRKYRRLPANLGLAAVHDASFMQQPKEGSQAAYCLMLCSTKMYEGRARTHLLDWGSGKIHRKMRSTLASEAASAAKAFDRGAYARVMLYEIEHGWPHKWDQLDLDDCDMRADWTVMCREIPFALGTDCKSLYDVCTKNGSMPEEKRVALDLMDVRESIEEMGDQIRWIPTDHMLVDCMTKNMPPDTMLNYLKSMEYAFKYDDVIKHTKRELAKTRKLAREAKSTEKKTVEECNFTTCVAQDKIVHYQDNFGDLAKQIGYRKAYVLVAELICPC